MNIGFWVLLYTFSFLSYFHRWNISPSAPSRRRPHLATDGIIPRDTTDVHLHIVPRNTASPSALFPLFYVFLFVSCAYTSPFNIYIHSLLLGLVFVDVHMCIWAPRRRSISLSFGVVWYCNGCHYVFLRGWNTRVHFLFFYDK